MAKKFHKGEDANKLQRAFTQLVNELYQNGCIDYMNESSAFAHIFNLRLKNAEKALEAFAKVTPVSVPYLDLSEVENAFLSHNCANLEAVGAGAMWENSRIRKLMEGEK